MVILSANHKVKKPPPMSRKPTPEEDKMVEDMEEVIS
jgi:hypothetical protein